MKVSGESTFWYQLTGQQQFKEASVKQEGSPGFFGLFGSKSITIDAGAGDDRISVRKLGPDQYEVDVNGQKFVLSEDEMKNLTIDCGSGNDSIIIDESVDIAINVKGGSGKDKIINEANGTKIDGGSGDDTIYSAGNFCEIMGGAGRDVIIVDGILNEVYGDKKATNFWEQLFGGMNDEQDWIIDEGLLNSIHD